MILEIVQLNYQISTETLELLLNFSNEETSDLYYINWLSLIEGHLNDFKTIIRNISLISYFPCPSNNDDLEVFLEGLKRRCSSEIKIHMYCRERNEVFLKFCDYIHENSNTIKVLVRGKDY